MASPESKSSYGMAEPKQAWHVPPEQTDWTESGAGRVYRGIVVMPHDAGGRVGFHLSITPDYAHYLSSMTVLRRPNASDGEPLTIENYEQAVELHKLLGEMIQQADAYATKAALSDQERRDGEDQAAQGIGKSYV